MIRAILLLLALAPLTVDCPAQHHTAGWIFTGIGTPPAPALGHIDLKGKMTTLVTQTTLGGSTFMEGGVMNTGNGQYVVAITSKQVHQSLMVVDLAGRILNTIQVSPNPPQNGGYINDVVVDHNGDFIVLEGPGGGQSMALYKLDQSFTVTTLHAGAPLRLPQSVTIDVNTGDFMVLDPGRLYRIKHDGSGITTVGTFRVPVQGQVTQDRRTGDFFAGSNLAQEPGALLVRMTPTGSATTFLAAGFSSCHAVAADRASEPNPRLAFGAPASNSGVHFVDLSTKVITGLLKGSSCRTTHLWPDRSSNLSTRKMSPGKWTATLSFPGEAGNGYVVGMTLSGTQPGVTLPDGRHLCFNMDDLTPLSVNGLLGPVFTGYTGTLDAAGTGTATLDVSSLPPLNHIKVWLLALTLDARAPLNIGTISDPVILIL